MSWTGGAPAEPVRESKLEPGYHRVKISKVVEMQSGDLLVVLSNSNGEATEFIPQDIRPRTKEEREAAKKAGQRGSTEWKFWRLVGAFDYPNPAYWTQLPADREHRTWDALTDLNKIKDSGVKCWIEIGRWWSDSKQQWMVQIEDARSLERHDLGGKDPGAAESIVLDLDGGAPPPTSSPSPSPSNEVPF